MFPAPKVHTGAMNLQDLEAMLGCKNTVKPPVETSRQSESRILPNGVPENATSGQKVDVSAKKHILLQDLFKSAAGKEENLETRAVNVSKMVCIGILNF